MKNLYHGSISDFDFIDVKAGAELLEMTFRKDNGINEYQLPLDFK